VSPVTGLVHSLHTVQSVGEPVVAAVRYRFGRRSTTLDDLMRNERHVAGGKGWRIEEAIRSAVFEALEHLSGVWRPSIPTRTTTASALGPTAILPQDVDGFSPSQRASPSPAGSLSALTVPHLLSPDAPIEWVEARPLAGGPSKWVPAAAAFYDAPFDGPRFALATSNGCAAGRNPEDAIWNGLVELIERDAVAIWWYNQIARPSLDPTSFPDPRPARFQAALSEKGRSLALFDITTDVGVPVVAAVSRRTTGDPTWVFGFGAAPTLTLAACRALTELAQLAPGADDPTQPPLTSWNTTATEVDLPHLATTSIGLPAAADDTPSDLPALLARLETLGVSAYAVDQTHPHIGVPVSRVIAPGLVHFWRRFGHSRLYETPVKLGWADAQRREEELSPFDLTI
jgi:ribosomal protein S12 methylthiotransferase accessory factor